MKVLHVLYSGLGGHGNVFFSMVDADRSGDIHYEVLFVGVEDVREEYIAKAEARNIPWYTVKKKPGTDLQAFRSVRRIIKNIAPDVVFIHGSTMLFYVKYRLPFFSKKFRLICRETQANHLKSRKEHFALRICLLLADKIVFLSKEYREEVRKSFPLLYSERRTAVIPNGIDLSLFKPSHETHNGVFHIGMQSRLISIKDYPTLLRAFAATLLRTATPMKLYIAGDGDCRESLMQLAEELKISDNVFFTGMLGEKALPDFINGLNLYIHASLGETMSTALMQVMACKKPIIASDVPGINNMIVHHSTGLLVPVQNVDALSDAILSLMQDKAKAAELADAAYQYAKENFDNRIMAERYRLIFTEK